MSKIHQNQQYTLQQSSDGSYHYSDGSIESASLRWVASPVKESYPEVKVTFRNGEM